MNNRQHAAVEIAFAGKIRRVIRPLEAVGTTHCQTGIGEEGGDVRYCRIARTAAPATEAEQMPPRDHSPQS